VGLVGPRRHRAHAGSRPLRDLDPDDPGAHRRGGGAAGGRDGGRSGGAPGERGRARQGGGPDGGRVLAAARVEPRPRGDAGRVRDRGRRLPGAARARCGVRAGDPRRRAKGRRDLPRHRRALGGDRPPVRQGAARRPRSDRAVSGVGALVSAALMVSVPPAAAPGAAPAVLRRPGPAGSLLIVEDDHSVPLVHVIVASRSGSAADPRHREGLTNLAAEWARHGAGGRTRAELDEALDALGGTLEVRTEQDVTRFEGEVLARNLDAYLALVADILIRPAFSPAEFARTRREVEAQIDESRNDDRLLCGRFFMRNVYGDHPYGHPVDGLKASLDAATASETAAHFRRH